MTVAQLKKNQKAVIVDINGDERLKKRLMALGCLEGTELKVVNKAPLGDPLVIRLRGFELALRKKDASNIKVSEEIN